MYVVDFIFFFRQLYSVYRGARDLINGLKGAILCTLYLSTCAINASTDHIGCARRVVVLNKPC